MGKRRSTSPSLLSNERMPNSFFIIRNGKLVVCLNPHHACSPVSEAPPVENKFVFHALSSKPGDYTHAWDQYCMGTHGRSIEEEPLLSQPCSLSDDLDLDELPLFDSIFCDEDISVDPLPDQGN